MSAISNRETVKIIHHCAVQYNKNLSGKNVLFVTIDNDKPACFEMLFRPNNFLRLTGVKTHLKSGQFYKAALNSRLSPDDISPNLGSATEIRLSILPKLMSIHKTARMIGDYDNARPLLITDKYAGTVTMAMGFINVNGFYIPNTTLKKSIRDIKAQAIRRKIAAVFVKPRRDTEYTVLTYITKGLAVDDDTLLPMLQGRVDLQNLTAAFTVPKRSDPPRT